MNTFEVAKTDYIPQSRQFSPMLTVPESYVGQKVEIWVFPVKEPQTAASSIGNTDHENMKQFFTEVDELRKVEPLDEALDEILASPALASEASLAKLWDTPEEDAAWASL
jgi:hypothetical protein